MKHVLFDIPIDDFSSEELDTTLNEWIKGSEQKMITTPNPEMMLLSMRDPAFKGLLQKSDLSLPDGVGLRFAIAALTDRCLQYRHTGVDLVDRLMKLAHETHQSVLFVGGEEGSAEKSKQVFEQKYHGIQISVFNPGQINLERLHSPPEADPPLADITPQLHHSTTLLLVALGQGKQEQFIKQMLPHLPSVRIAVGIGGAFEMLSGKKPRAPKLMQRLGIEWLWRVLIEPRRIGRIFRATIIFPIVVISATLKQHRFWKACRNVFPEVFRQLTGKKSKSV